ncbi:hypothetical protein ACIF8T_09845 [Streptomyces sp. NPDC085946]|uniref:hypothetical protein n=1 Tax=Streptomyces sp. NPDC085946 TaxID=3365744 RepID=UPI0037D4A19B
MARPRGPGHPAAAGPGTGGGYRLGAGAEPPPLPGNEEAVVVGPRTAAGQGVEGIGET